MAPNAHPLRTGESALKRGDIVRLVTGEGPKMVVLFTYKTEENKRIRALVSLYYWADQFVNIEMDEDLLFRVS